MDYFRQMDSFQLRRQKSTGDPVLDLRVAPDVLAKTPVQTFLDLSGAVEVFTLLLLLPLVRGRQSPIIITSGS